MNRYTATWGGLLAVSGVAMHFLLIALGEQEFFMAPTYLPPAQLVSYGVIVGGVVLVLLSFLSNWPSYSGISGEAASAYFGRVALVNGVAAALFASAMLVPPLLLPILLAEWPGIYIVVAYTFFIVVGVFGMLGWSMMYRSATFFFSRDHFDKRSVLVQLVLSEVAIYVVSTVLFLAGYRGASLVYSSPGVLPPFVGASMEFSDIPAAVSIFLLIVSVVLGALNLTTGKSRTS